MLKDKDCSIILTLAGSLFSAGLKKVVFDLIENNMVDAIVSTGAIMVDQDFFEALGFKHYIGSVKGNPPLTGFCGDLPIDPMEHCRFSIWPTVRRRHACGSIQF